jgi:hypothetical protein
MKNFVFMLLCLVMPTLAFAQVDTCRVASDVGTGGNLNDSVTAVIGRDPTFAKFNNTVFKLEPYGYYILTATITTPAHSNFRLEGDRKSVV